MQINSKFASICGIRQKDLRQKDKIRAKKMCSSYFCRPCFCRLLLLPQLYFRRPPNLSITLDMLDRSARFLRRCCFQGMGHEAHAYKNCDREMSRAGVIEFFYPQFSHQRVGFGIQALTRMPSIRGSTRRSSAEFDDSPFAGGSFADSPQRRRTFVWPSCGLY